MHGLIKAQGLYIGPLKHPRTNKRHGFGVGQGDELDVFGAAQRLDLLDQLAHGITDPGDHHGPALNAAQAVDALLHGFEFEQVFERVLSWFFDQTLHLHSPRRGLQCVGVFGGFGLVGAELVEIVVAAGVFVVGQLVHGHGAGHARLLASQRRQLTRSLGASGLRPGGASSPGGQGRPA